MADTISTTSRARRARASRPTADLDFHLRDLRFHRDELSRYQAMAAVIAGFIARHEAACAEHVAACARLSGERVLGIVAAGGLRDHDARIAA